MRIFPTKDMLHVLMSLKLKTLKVKNIKDKEHRRIVLF